MKKAFAAFYIRTFVTLFHTTRSPAGHENTQTCCYNYMKVYCFWLSYICETVLSLCIESTDSTYDINVTVAMLPFFLPPVSHNTHSGKTSLKPLGLSLSLLPCGIYSHGGVPFNHGGVPFGHVGVPFSHVGGFHSCWGFCIAATLCEGMMYLSVSTIMSWWHPSFECLFESPSEANPEKYSTIKSKFYGRAQVS